MDRLRRDAFEWEDALPAGGALPSPGKVTATARLRHDGGGAEEHAPHPLAAPLHGTVRMYGGAAQVDDAFAVHTLASAGIAGPAQPLPHRDAIQRSFGHHDVSGVRAHVGGPAAHATEALGAPAYATGTDVAFGAQPDLRQAAHEAAHVVQHAQGVNFDGPGGAAGDAHERHADAVADDVVSGRSAEARLDAGPGGGGRTGTAANLEAFATEFNREFQAQLHVFAEGDAAAEPAAERGRDVTSVETGASSGNAVSAERLGRLFTATQRDKLMTFCTTHVIPERLFNGDDVGTTTAQQRILMAGHILAVGTYAPGGFEQSVHARMCGHWVNLTLHYAGCADGAGRGVREEFDHSGGLSMSVTDTPEGGVTGADRTTLGAELGVGRRGAAAEGRRADFEMAGLPFDSYQMLEPGDWLWVYNDCGPGGGNHSIIFSRWASPVQTHEGVRYRRALTMSQISPDAGGREETRLLGESFTDTGNGRITPVTHIERVASGTRPMQTAADLIAILGSGAEAAENTRFIEQRLRSSGGTFDWDRLLAWIRTQNRALIERLRPHMTEHQLTAFNETNDGAAPVPGDADTSASEAQVPRMVRLNERLNVLVDNAGALDEGMAAQRTSISEHREERMAATAEPRARLEARIEALQVELHDLNERHGPLVEASEHFAEASAELRGYYVERRTGRQRRNEIRTELRNSSMGADDRTELSAELERINTRLTELAPLIEALEEQDHDRAYRAERTAARRAARAVEVQINQKTQRLVRDQRDLARLMASAGYVTAHGRVGREDFNGVGEARRLTGLLRNLAPAPDWGSFITAGGSVGVRGGRDDR